MLYCPKARCFWISFFDWWNRVSEVIIPLDFLNLEENVIFGFQSDDDLFKVLNHCALIAKFYIYRKKMFNNNDIDFYDYLYELKYKLQIERNICIKNNNEESFKRYQFIYQQL